MVQKSKEPAPESGKEKEKKSTTEVATKDPTYSERFSNMVIHEFSGNVGEVTLTAFQKRLIQNYFIAVDIAIKKAEENRMKKQEADRDEVPVAWPNVNMEALALSVVAFAKVEYDPALPNHISMAPYKNNKTKKYDIVFIEGYRGRELKAKKYGFDVPDRVIVKLVFKGEKFVPVFKDKDNTVETYIHKPSDDPFARKEIVGGYYYHSFKEQPEKNKLMYYNLDEIEKRKPRYASVEFWGGEKAIWEKDPETGRNKKKGTEYVEGYHTEMCWKTLYHMAYRDITIDSKKIDDNLMQILENERALEAGREPQNLEALRETNVEQKGNKKTIVAEDVKFEEVSKPTGPAAEENVASLADLGTQQDGPGY